MAQDIDREGVRRLMERGAQIVDVLPAREYGEDHLPGAINLPLRRIEAEAARALACSSSGSCVLGRARTGRS